MKHIGITRNVDHLGRIVLPKELRDSLDLPAGTPMDISVEGDTILLKKHRPHDRCVFCGKEDPNAIVVNDVCVCSACLSKLREL